MVSSLEPYDALKIKPDSEFDVQQGLLVYTGDRTGGFMLRLFYGIMNFSEVSFDGWNKLPCRFVGMEQHKMFGYDHNFGNAKLKVEEEPLGHIEIWPPTFLFSKNAEEQQKLGQEKYDFKKQASFCLDYLLMQTAMRKANRKDLIENSFAKLGL